MHTERKIAQLRHRDLRGRGAHGVRLVRGDVHLGIQQQHPEQCIKSHRPTHGGVLCAPCRRSCKFAGLAPSIC